VTNRSQSQLGDSGVAQFEPVKQGVGNERKDRTNTAGSAASWTPRNREDRQVLRIAVPAGATKAFQPLNAGEKVDGTGKAWWAPMHALKGAVVEVSGGAPVGTVQ
jgi:hypothetical protein